MSVAINSRKDLWLWDNTPASWDDTTVTWDSSYRTYFEVSASDTVTTTDARRQKNDKHLQESVAVIETDTRTTKASRMFAERVSWSEKPIAHTSREVAEKVSIAEFYDKQMAFLVKMLEGVTIEEVFSRKVLFAERKLFENVTVDDTDGKSINAVKTESFPQVYDAFLENANAVLDMVSFYTGEMDEKIFRELTNKPNGYSSFQEFYVGDYEYQRALVRLSIRSEQLNSGIHLCGVVHNVDIPDTDDRGTVEITDASAPTKVYYNKFYYNAPEVSVTQKGGNTGDGIVVPIITSVFNEDDIGQYFEVELLTASGARTTGTIIWVSKGY